MNLVLDTNILVAALRSKRGASNALLSTILEGDEITWSCSVPLFLEYEEVLTRAEFVLETRRSREEYGAFLADIASVVHPVELHFLWRPQLSDPKDEMVLETAVNASADAIVTFNHRDFRPVQHRFEVQIWTPQQALERIRQ